MSRPADATPAGREHFHPLEIIPVFRRWPRSALRDLLYTAIWSSLFGLGFYVLGAAGAGHLPGWDAFGAYVLISNAIGFVIHGLYEVGRYSGIEAWARKTNFASRVAYYALVPILGVPIGLYVSSFITGRALLPWMMRPGVLSSILFSSLVISLVLSVIFFWRERSAHAEAAIAVERARSEAVQRQAALATLRALQAQIEPHFLFNTLANVSSLIDADPAKAKGMLESFIRFLRASLAATREEQTTLGAEAKLIAAYLDVIQVRMGTRLRYVIDVAPEVQGFAVPSMLLQPIVENAIRHGLEPKVEGGEVAFRARREGDAVQVEITDTGVGFAPVTQGGVGLENLRERLRILYAGRASLAIVDNQPAGTRVRLALPA